jgi:undecaprenyl-diphosphatase
MRFFRQLLSHPELFSKRTVAIVLLYAIGLTLFLSIYDGVQEKEDLAVFDEPLLAWATSNQHPHLTQAMHIITDIMSPIAVGIMTVIGAGLWMWRKKEYWRPAIVVGAVSLAFGAAAIIKTYTARARPTVTDLLEANAAISYSFPSGHTIGVAILLLILSYFFCVSKLSWQRLAVWLTITTFGISLVAFSRIYLGYHWLTDVSASVGLAIIVLAIAITVDTYKHRLTRKKTIS